MQARVTKVTYRAVGRFENLRGNYEKEVFQKENGFDSVIIFLSKYGENDCLPLLPPSPGSDGPGMVQRSQMLACLFIRSIQFMDFFTAPPFPLSL